MVDYKERTPLHLVYYCNENDYENVNKNENEYENENVYEDYNTIEIIKLLVTDENKNMIN